MESGSTDCKSSAPSDEKTQRGLRLSYAPLDKQVWLWYENSTKNNEKLTRCDIQNYARTIYLQANIQTFKASDGWYRRWRQRWFKKGSILETRTELQDNDLQDDDHDFLAGINVDFPDFDENLFSIGESQKFTEALEILEREHALQQKQTCRESNRVRKRPMPAKNKVTVTKEKNPCSKDLRYKQEFKEEVVSYAMNHPFSASAEKFNIHQVTVSKWTKDCGSDPVNKEIEKSELPSIETYFADWLKQIRLAGKRISKSEVQEEVTKIKEQQNYTLSKWFPLYYKRLYDGSTNSIVYPQIVKTEVVKLAECWSQKYVSSILNIARKQIYNWSKEALPENSLTKIAGKKDDIGKSLWEWYVERELKPSQREIWQQAAEISRRKGYNIKITKSWYHKWCSAYDARTNSILDKELLEWILLKFDQNATPTQSYIRKKCLSLHKNIYGKTNFKASVSWVVTFCKRYSDILQKPPSLEISLPAKCEAREKKYRETLKRLISGKAITLDRIGIMDETALRISTKKLKRSLKLCSFRNIEGSFILACTASGRILPLMVILKGPTTRIEKQDGLFVAYQPKGIIDASIMEFWVKEVWMNHVCHPNILILDRYQPHVEPPIKEMFARTQNFLAPISSGCTSHFVWVLSDVCQFISDRVNQEWQLWLKNYEDNVWDDSESSKTPSPSEIISWIKTAFMESRTKFQAEVGDNLQKLITL